MTLWDPRRSLPKGAGYQALAEAIDRAVREGQLVAGARMPTQREMARLTGLNLTTVGRAYALASKKGLLSTEIGRGTFVRTMKMPDMLHWPKGAPVNGIDFSTNLPGATAGLEELNQATASLHDESVRRLLAYHSAWGVPEHRATSALWLQDLGVSVSPEQILVVSGAMHAMALCLMAICQPGDRVLVEELTSPGILSLCDALGLRVEGVPIDEYGMTVAGLDAALEEGMAKAIVLVPNLQNPTLAIMPEQRRDAIAETVKKRRLFIIENDVYGPLLENRPRTVFSYAPNWTCYVTSLSKAAAPGLRMGWLVPPPSLLRTARDRLQVTNGTTSPLLSHIASTWIANGTAERLTQRQRTEASHRQDIALKILDGLNFASHPAALHIWLTLPEPWRSEEFAAYAQERDIALLPSEAFTVSRGYRRKVVRISLCNGNIKELETGLLKLRAILDGRI